MTDEPTKAKGETTHPDWTGAAAPGSAPGHAALPNALRIGRYAIVRVLGEGGMGTVYEAQQESPKRTVALKVIRAGYLSPELLRRFTQESQVLGRLQHPGIAQVYEAGMAKDERGHELPFFAMEFIKGVPLTEYVTQKKLGTRDRLELVAKVCDAVYHAHQKGVIHRDLKPGNIIVDESGQPKILDFGIARATDSDIQQTTLQTDIGQLIGTIPYMSPEQVSGDPNDLDTRSDVYALGVIAYEILAGRLPYDLQRKMIHEAARIIREEDPTRLSSINRTLRGDVETIVAKALEKDKLRRYQSAESFASDIRRYLKHEPITARPANTWYQAQKFARRNTGLVAGVGAAFVLLISGLVGTGYGLRQAVTARDNETAARKDADVQKDAAVAARKAEELHRKTAEAQRDKAEKIAEFMSDMLKGAGPSAARGRDATMLKEMMDAAAARIEKKDLSSAPEAELRLRGTIGSTYLELAEFSRAQEMLEPALELARATLPGGHPDIATSLNHLALLLRAQNKLAQAEPLSREALEILRAALRADHPDIATLLSNHASLLQAQNRLAEAEPLFREALAILRAAFPAGHPDIAKGLNNLAALAYAQDKLALSESLYREALDIRRAVLPAAHPDIAISLNDLARLLHNQNRLAQAEPLYREALEILRAAFPAAHPDVANTLGNLALLLKGRNQHAEADPLLREALEIRRAALPAGHPDIAVSLNSLASLLHDQNKLTEAEPLLREALEIRRAALPAGHPGIATGLNNLALLLQDQNRPAEAEPLFREALEIRRAALPARHPEIAISLNNLASLMHAQGKFAEAEPLFREALEIRRAALPAGHPGIATGLGNLASVLLAQSKAAESEPLFREALKIDRAALPAGHPGIATDLNNLAGLLQAQNMHTEAEPLYREALEIRRAALPAGHPNIQASLVKHAEILETMGTHTEAEGRWRELLKIREAVLPVGDWRTPNTKSRLGGSLLAQIRFADAEPLLIEGFEGLAAAKNTPRKPDDRLREGCERVVRLYESWDKTEPGKGYDVKAAEWRARLDALTPPALDSTPPAG